MLELISELPSAGEVFLWDATLIWPLVIEKVLHILAYTTISVGMVLLIWKPWGYCVARVKPTMLTLSALIFSYAISEFLLLLCVWVPIYEVYIWWSMVSMGIAVGAVGMAWHDRKTILEVFLRADIDYEHYIKSLEKFTAISIPVGIAIIAMIWIPTIL